MGDRRDLGQEKARRDPYPGPSRGQRLAQLAARQESIVELSQRNVLGFTYAGVKGLVAKGVLHQLHRGVYVYGNPNVAPHARLRAALCACGTESFLTHSSAESAYGRRPINRYKIEVTVPGSGGRSRRGLILHRTRTPIDKRDVTTRNGLRVSTFGRLLVDMSAREKPRYLQELIRFGVHKRLFNPNDVEAAIARHVRRPGIAVLKGAAARYRPHPDRKSNLERSVGRWLGTRPDIPEPESNVQVGIWEVDMLWREQGVALELDGRDYHAAVEEFDRDRIKDRQLIRMGLKPIRISDFEWEYAREPAIDDLLALLGLVPPTILVARAQDSALLLGV
ncbi:MAG: hypothetical protein ACYDHH_01385 [Solirubrobacteraceae bacterium]